MFRVIIIVFATLLALTNATIFEHEVLDAENNIVKLSIYDSAKAILIGKLILSLANIDCNFCDYSKHCQ